MRSRALQSALSLVVGFSIGLAALLVSIWLDPRAGDLDLPRRAAACILAGLAWAVSSVPMLREAIPGSDASTGLWRLSVACAAAVSLLLSVSVLVGLAIPASWLFSYCALAFLLDWLTRRWILRDQPEPAASWALPSRIASYLAAVSPAPFAAAGLVLFAQAVVYVFLNRQPQAERLTNLGFALLVVAVGLAIFAALSPPKAKGWIARAPTLGTALVAAGLLVLSLLSRIEYTQAESAFLVDTLPSYIDVRMRGFPGNSIVLSDSSNLRLWNILQVYPALDLTPDRRGPALWSDLAVALRGEKYAYWVQDPDESNDTLGYLSSFLQANGCLDDPSQTILPVKPFELRTPLVAPRALPAAIAAQTAGAFQPVRIDWGPVQLTGFNYVPRVCSHDAAAVSLRWRSTQKSDQPLEATLILVDSKGREIQSEDFPIEDTARVNAAQPPAGSEVYSYDLLPVPLGTPPGDYALRIGVFEAGASQRLRIAAVVGASAAGLDLVSLGTVHVETAEDYTADPYNTLQASNLTPVKTDVADGLRLAAYGVSAQSVLPGATLTVTARWRALRNGLPSYLVRLGLVQSGQVIAETRGVPADGTYPTDAWRANEIVVDRIDLRVPPSAQGGTAQLEIGVANGRAVSLGTVAVASITHTWQAPAVEYPAEAGFGIASLVGYDLAQASVSANQSLPLTLYWRADASPIDVGYNVFAQLLAEDGHLVAQSDGAPAGGQRPTWGWIKGEYIADPRVLDFVDKNYAGPAYLIVGMYDPATGKRLPVAGGDFAKLATGMRVTVR